MNQIKIYVDRAEGFVYSRTHTVMVLRDKEIIMIITNDTEYYTNNMIADVILAMMKYLVHCNTSTDFQVEVGKFDNCREYGNTYRVLNAKQDYTFCVYEHRNSDQICINGCPTEEIKIYGPYTDGSKYDYHYSVSYDEHYRAAIKLMEFLVECKNGTFCDQFKK